MIKEIFEVIRGGLFLEFKSDEGKINCAVLVFVVLLTGGYIFYKTQVAVAVIQYMHKLPEPLSLTSCFIPVVIVAICCFILMCLKYVSTRNLGNKVKHLRR